MLHPGISYKLVAVIHFQNIITYLEYWEVFGTFQEYFVPKARASLVPSWTDLSVYQPSTVPSCVLGCFRRWVSRWKEGKKTPTWECELSSPGSTTIYVFKNILELLSASLSLLVCRTHWPVLSPNAATSIEHGCRANMERGHLLPPCPSGSLLLLSNSFLCDESIPSSRGLPRQGGKQLKTSFRNSRKLIRLSKLLPPRVNKAARLSQKKQG